MRRELRSLCEPDSSGSGAAGTPGAKDATLVTRSYLRGIDARVMELIRRGRATEESSVGAGSVSVRTARKMEEDSELKESPMFCLG